MILDDKNKAEAMNDYFVAVGPNLASQINPIPYFRDMEHIYRITPTLSGVNLNKIDLLRRIKSINPKKASGPDSIAPRDLHLIGEASAEGLLTVFRHSLLNSTFPFSGDLLEWMVSYLKDRKQYAEVNGWCSQTKSVTYGAPQGSLLGPRFFTYYINDLSDSVTEVNLELYADDTTLHFIGNNVDVVVDGSNRALSEISLWSRNNKLTLHAGKSEAVIISHSPFCGPLRPIKLGDNILNVVYETRCLGVIIDSQLSWTSHLEHLCKSFGKKVRQLKRFKYFSSIAPTVTYCSLVWGTGTPSLMNELDLIHSRAAKIIHRLPWDISDQEALENTRWEPL